MKPVILLFGTVLDWFYRYTGDYGLAIVCLTVLVKLCLLPLYGAHRGRTDERQAGAGSCLLLLVTLPVRTGLYRTVLAGAAGPALAAVPVGHPGERLQPGPGPLPYRGGGPGEPGLHPPHPGAPGQDTGGLADGGAGHRRPGPLLGRDR